MPGSGETVELRALAGGRERVVATALTAPDGSWSVTPPALSRSSVLRAVFPGEGADAPGIISPLVGVTVVPAISIKADRMRATPGDTITVTGSVRPSKRRVSLSVARGAHQASVRRIATDSGRFSAKVKLARAGTYRITASVPADGRTTSARSSAIRVQAG